MRERRPGVWEVRIAVGTDPATGRTLQRSVTVHGTAAEADACREAVIAARDAGRTRPSPLLTVGELLDAWLEADHPWKPSTRVGYESNVRYLRGDTHLARRRVIGLTPNELRQTFARWQAEGATHSVVGGRFRVLRAAVGWAYDERIIDTHPIRSMRGPGRLEPRRPLTDDQVAGLLAAAEAAVLEAVANDTGTTATRRRRHHAGQDLLLVRLAADSGARRGELAALHFDDLDGRVLHIRRAFSADVVTTPKSGRGRSLTLGSSTARLWRTLDADWRTRQSTGARFGRGCSARTRTTPRR